MPATPDRSPQPLEEDQEIRMGPGVTTQPSVDGGVVFRSDLGVFQFREAGGTIQTFGGSGITAPQHEALDTLVHNLSETSYEEITRDGSGRMQDFTAWTDNTKVTKVREVSVTRDGGGRVATVVARQYNGTGTLVQTLTKTMTRDGSGRFQSFAVVET